MCGESRQRLLLAMRRLILGNRGKAQMTANDRVATSRSLFRYICAGLTLFAVGTVSSQAHAETFEGPSFRKGMWHFVRTVDLVGHRKDKQRLLAREMTRCVDPTHAMKATFSSPSVGSCVSSKPERSENKYLFANRCDHMGPVSTVITVHNNQSYTELNELTAGKLPRRELIVAQRVGDCPDEEPAKSAALAH